MQNFRNYYKILGIGTDVSGDEIKRAYRKLAMKYHPDLNPGDKVAEERFKDLGEAYEVLYDEAKRAEYDKFTRYWQQKGSRKGKVSGVRNGTSRGQDYSQYGDFNSFIDQLMGRRRETGVGVKNRPPSTRITTKDAYRPGTTKSAYTVGGSDYGTRTKKAERPPSTKKSRRNVEARLTLPLEKAYKGGEERIRLEDGRSLEVEMPEGMVNGQKIRLRGQGINGGDLYLKITVKPHSFFVLQGENIFCQVPLTPSEAVLGRAVEVPTLDGLVKMNVPQGVKSGQRLRLANKGYPDAEGKRGDQLVEIQIVLPQEISPEEKELYEKLREVETFQPRRDLLK